MFEESENQFDLTSLEVMNEEKFDISVSFWRVTLAVFDQLNEFHWFSLSLNNQYE